MTLRFATAACNCGLHCAYCYIDVDPANVNSIGISESNSDGVHVYPNPSSNGIFVVQISWNEQPPTVFDIGGRVVDAKCTHTGSGWIIDISQLPKGTYFAQIPGPDGVKHCNLVR